MAKQLLQILKTVQVGKTRAALIGQRLVVNSVLEVDDDKLVKDLTKARPGGQLAVVITADQANALKAAAKKVGKPAPVKPAAPAAQG